jgi:glycyl-tRNA synthetase beta subunit
VMHEDLALRHARLRLMAALRDLILGLADISEIAGSEA